MLLDELLNDGLGDVGDVGVARVDSGDDEDGRPRGWGRRLEMQYLQGGRAAGGKAVG
jgi:hypothetical protein